jgi:NTE family protein
MPIPEGLASRLGAATSGKTLGPILGGDGRGGSLATTVLDDITNGDRIRRSGKTFTQFRSGPQLVTAIPELVRAQPESRDVVVNVFDETPSPELEQFQTAFLTTSFLSTLVLAAGLGRLDGGLDDLIRVSASATPAGQILRRLFADPGQPAPVDPMDGLPGMPGTLEGLLAAGEKFRRKGCAGAVRQALRNLGQTVSSATPRYLTGVIDALVPPDNCPGTEMTIVGHDLGNGPGSAVAFTGEDGRVVLTPKSGILEWTNDHIRLVIPFGAARGPVGILVFAQGGTTTIASSVSTALGEIEACFGPMALAQAEQTLGQVTGPPLFPPSSDPRRVNLYSGGPPIIDYFEVTPSPMLWPGRTIRLSWSVTGADFLEIVPEQVGGSAPNELPPITSPLTYPSGSVSVTVPGTHRWRGAYVLRAGNKCTRARMPAKRPKGWRHTPPSESRVFLEMAARRGLALGGGGTRGDFQTGALLYLYDERGFRPEAIAGTSVGSINAIDLVMGDDSATATSPARSAASRLATTWRGLVDESSMWGQETWLTNAKADVRRTLRSISIEGLLALPYTVVADIINVSDVEDVYQNPRAHGVVAFFNLNPIEARARGQYKQSRTNASGIKLRLVAVSVETGALIMVDETGGVRERGPTPIRPATVAAAPSTDVVDGAIASATMPSIFPARRLHDHMCVDGGVRDVVPVQVAVHDLGCNNVVAIRCSAPPPVLETDPTRPVGEVMARSVLELTYDELADNDVAPYGGWGDGVAVTVIRPSFDLHDPMVVEPGLIRIALDYGWMRAADVLDVTEAERSYAMQLSDAITRLRAENWTHAHYAAGAPYLDPHRGFTDFVFAGIAGATPSEIQPVPSPEAVEATRANCLLIRQRVSERLQIGAPTPSSAVRTSWFTTWETIGTAMPTNDPWQRFVSVAGVVDAATPPPAI